MLATTQTPKLEAHRRPTTSPFSPSPRAAAGTTLSRKPRCACGGGCPRCRSPHRTGTTLAVSQPGDAHERDADAVAERALRDQLDSSPLGSSPRRKAVAGAGAAPSSARNLVQGIGSGQPLPAETRAFFEPRLDFGLENVRVHTGERAAASADALSARAYTLGSHVVFARGGYAPHSETGRRLLAHELAHVTQQSEGRAPPRIQRSITVQNPTATTGRHTRNNGDVVVSLFDDLCPSTRWQLAGSEVVPTTSDFCDTAAAGSATNVSCQCACNFTSASGPHVEIEIHPTRDDTQFASGPSRNSFNMRLTGFAATGIRGVSGGAIASGSSSLTTLRDPPWLILGHELCGHAQTTLPGIGTAGRASSVSHESTANWDQSAIDIENQIRREHSARLGTDLGTRAGDFDDVEGHIHFGAIVELPSAMTLSTLLSTLGVPTGDHLPRCHVAGWYHLCGAAGNIATIRVLDRVAYRTGGNFNVATRCLGQSFAAGDFFAVEGVFWHLANGTDTKTSIAARWGVSVAALDAANAVFSTSVPPLSATAAIPSGTSVIVPYRTAPGSTRFFFQRATGPC